MVCFGFRNALLLQESGNVSEREVSIFFGVDIHSPTTITNNHNHNHNNNNNNTYKNPIF
jgi:hypothetical protein